jgi:glycosyltransferase involved in cell wall biosynthesis
MKVCFVSHSSAKGGGERSLLETIHVLESRGVECAVLLPRRGPLCDDLERIGVRFAILPYRWWTGPEDGPLWRLWSVPLALQVRRWRPDLLYTNTVVVPLGAIAATLLGRPHVWHVRELGYIHTRRVFDLGQRATLAVMERFSALILTNSECVAEQYRPTFGEARVAVVYQAVTPDRREGVHVPPNDKGFRFVAVGSIGPSKRQEEAIEAVARLAGEGREVELLIIGRGDPVYEQKLRALAAELGMERRVSFLGEVPTAWPFIESADAVVHCSRYEAFGRVTVEGMLAGKPVVGVRCAGTAELIRDGFNGRLYEMGDVAQLSAILGELIDQPEERSRLGATARAWAEERFTEDRYGDALVDHLRRVLESG